MQKRTVYVKKIDEGSSFFWRGIFELKKGVNILALPRLCKIDFVNILI
jgi:hypothetical protein